MFGHMKWVWFGCVLGGGGANVTAKHFSSSRGKSLPLRD